MLSVCHVPPTKNTVRNHEIPNMMHEPSALSQFLHTVAESTAALYATAGCDAVALNPTKAGVVITIRLAEIIDQKMLLKIKAMK